MKVYSNRIIIAISLCLVLLLFGGMFHSTNQSTMLKLNMNSEAPRTAQEPESEHLCLDIPWQQMIGPLGFACPASLAMIFDYYGVKVDQDDVFRESFSKRVWPNGTDPKYFARAASFDYNGEGWGFQGTTMTLEHLNHEQRLEFVKEYLREGIPVVAIPKGYPDWPCHYKVFIGFDDRTKDWFFNDPWYQGPDPNGPMSIDSYDVGQRFEGTWINTDHMIGLVIPIRVALEIPTRPISASEEFSLICSIDASHLELDSNISLNPTLPEGYSIIEGLENPNMALIGNRTEYSWTIRSSASPSVDDEIRVLVTATKGSSTIGGFDVINPNQPESPIIDRPSTDYADDNPPFRFDLYSKVQYEGTYSIDFAVFSYSDSTRFYPDYYPVVPISDELSGSVEAFRPSSTVFCWVLVHTPYGNYSSDRCIYLIQSSDWDDDGLDGYKEVVVYKTDPNQNDTDHDFLSDFDEVEVYHTDPLLNDTDSDLLLDGLEIAAGTDPRNPDCDLDGDYDGLEVQYGLDPLNPDSNLSTLRQQIVIVAGVGVILGVAVVLGLLVRRDRMKESPASSTDML